MVGDRARGGRHLSRLFYGLPINLTGLLGGRGKDGGGSCRLCRYWPVFLQLFYTAAVDRVLCSGARDICARAKPAARVILRDPEILVYTLITCR